MVDDPDDERVGPLARSLMMEATFIGLRDDASELAAVIKVIRCPLPTLPIDAVQREQVLALALKAKHQAANQFLAMVACGM